MGTGARCLRLLLAAAAAVVLARVVAGGWWLSLPIALWLASEEPTAREGAAAGGIVLAVAAVVAPPELTAAVLSAPLSVAALVLARVRLERQRDRMRRYALCDPLTGLRNRRALDDRLRHEIARHQRSGQRFAVLVLDLDGFKPVNDRFGHEAGDEVLRDVAGALMSAVRAQDTVARLGGDEFCIVAPVTDGPGAAHLEERVLEALAALTTGVSGLSASVGIALYPDDASQAPDLIAHADETVLAAKRRRYAGRPRRAAA